MELDLHYKQVVVVGGRQGIGLSIVKNFLREGSVVHVISRTIDLSLVDDLEHRYTSRIFFYQADATLEESLFLAFKKILINSNFKIDILISNVGNGSGIVDYIPDEMEWEISWNNNFKSALNSVRVFSSIITECKGSITFISSIAGIEHLGAPVSYSTAKSALNAFAKSLSYQFSPDVRVNVVAPGNIFIENGVWHKKLNQNSESVEKMLRDKVPLQRFGLPDEVSDLVVFISSNRASFITGACFVIDGGQTVGY